jgi:hypothetical protein
MVKKVNSEIASKGEFVDRHNGIIQSIIPKSVRKYNSYTTFEFNDKYIARLPFCDTTGGIDLYDRTTTIDEHGKEVTGAILVLRIQKRTKTFYFRYKNKMQSSLGRWTGDTSKSHYTKDEACVRIARERMAKEVRLIESRDSSVAHIAEWTIEDYINKRYSQDREKYTIQRGEIKSVTERTKNDIIRDLGDYKQKRIKDVEKSWIEPLIKEWKRPKLNKANGRVLAKAKGTCKKAYTEINAMFNICVKAGYIAINPLRDEMWRFKEENTSEKEINIIDEDPDTLLRFIFEVAPVQCKARCCSQPCAWQA